MIDIVMPVRDGGAWMPLAVRSLQEQTDADWRLLVVDDGSVDGSDAWIAEQDDDRLVLLRSSGSGIVDALNTGVAAVRTPWFARMDADDLCAPDRLRDQRDRAVGDTRLVALGTAYQVIDEDGGHLGTQVVPTGPPVVRAVLRDTNPFCHGSLLLRTDAVRACGGYRDRFPLAEDYDLVLRLSALGDLDNLGELLYSWRLSGRSSSVRRAREQARQAARARAAAHDAGLVTGPTARRRLEDALAPVLQAWEARRPVPEPVALARWRAGLHRGAGDARRALDAYDEVLRLRPLDVAARLRRRRARAGR